MAQTATHEWWETTLLCCGFAAFFVLSLWLYYRTSESYYLRSVLPAFAALLCLPRGLSKTQQARGACFACPRQPLWHPE